MRERASERPSACGKTMKVGEKEEKKANLREKHADRPAFTRATKWIHYAVIRGISHLNRGSAVGGCIQRGH